MSAVFEVTLRKETADFSGLSKLTVKISYWVEFVDTMAHGTFSLDTAIEFSTHVENISKVCIRSNIALLTVLN
jgi:hypothetical protein